MADGVVALFCMGFLAGAIVAIFMHIFLLYQKTKKDGNDKNEQRIN